MENKRRALSGRLPPDRDPVAALEHRLTALRREYLTVLRHREKLRSGRKITRTTTTRGSTDTVRPASIERTLTRFELWIHQAETELAKWTRRAP